MLALPEAATIAGIHGPLQTGTDPFSLEVDPPAWSVAGVAPATMGIGPVPATAKVLARAGLVMDDLDPDRTQRGLRSPGARGH